MSKAEILIVGRNRNNLFKKLQKNGISLLGVENIDEKQLIIIVKAKDVKKVFAICGNMWYNKLIKLTGISGLFAKAKKRAALIVALVSFFIVSAYADRLIFDVSVGGVSQAEQNEIKRVLSENGVSRFSRFSSLDLSEIEASTRALSDDYSFVTAKKRGNKLIIDVFQAEDKVSLKDYSTKNLIATESGTIKKLVVYRGIAVKSVGDKVEKGEMLVRGEFEFQDKIFESFALAKAEIEVNFDYEYTAESESEENKENAVALAKHFCPSEDAKLESVDTLSVGEGKIYKVRLSYIIKCGG